MVSKQFHNTEQGNDKISDANIKSKPISVQLIVAEFVYYELIKFSNKAIQK